MTLSPTPRRFLLSRRSVLAGALSLPLANCRGNQGFVARAGAATLSETPVLHIATTRRLVGDGTKSPFLDGARSMQPVFAEADLAPPDGSTIGQLARLVSADFGVQRVRVLPEGRDAFANGLRGRDTLLFVHGFNQTFEAAAADAAKLSHGIGFRGNTALFSWASKGGLLDYGYDRESALLARDPLAETLHGLLTDDFGARLHLVAHSMGTLVMLEALRIHRDRSKDAGLDRVGALVLAAPDIDQDVFRASIAKLGPWREKITVITSTNDRALGLSQRLAGGARVGALPADALADLGLKVIDATEFSSGFIRHDAFVANADVRAAIQRAVQRAV